jgi:NAD(P)H-dependent FMN reductase
MPRIIIVTGSARPTTVATQLAPLVMDMLRSYEGVDAQLIDIASLDLPFFDAPVAPSHEDFAPTDERVIAWTRMVAEADGVVLLTPEYNANVSAIQKNAIDWIYKEWHDKPVAFVGYGWYNPSRVQTALRASFEQVLSARLVEPFTQLQFAKDIDTDGMVIDQPAVDRSLTATIDALVDALGAV